MAFELDIDGAAQQAVFPSPLGTALAASIEALILMDCLNHTVYKEDDMREARLVDFKPLLGALLLAAASAHAQNPQLRPPSPATATGISADSAASMPLPSARDKDQNYDTLPPTATGAGSGVITPDKGPRTKFKDKADRPSKSKRSKSSAAAEPSDPHQVNGKAAGGPDNKASQPEPGGRGTGLNR